MAEGAAPGARPSPWAMPWAEWKAVLRRTWRELTDDNVDLIAAGAAFYAFLAIVPALGAVVLLYGLLADPQTLREHIVKLFEVLPRDAARAVAEQLAMVVDGSEAKKGFGLVLALALAIYGATKATVAIRTALNIAYGLKETRSFIRLQLLAVVMVLGGMGLMLLAILVNASLAWMAEAIHSPAIELLVKIVSYLVLGLVVVTGAACLYRFGPNHSNPRWVWLSPGAVLAAMLWLIATAGFAVYAANWGNYGATYGSLSAIVVLLTWLSLSAYVFLLGAELNSEFEHEVAAPAPKPEPVSAPVVLSPPPPPVPRQAPPSGGTLASGAVAKLGARAGGARLPLGQALLAGAGFAQLRRGSPRGLALVAGSAALAWFTRARR
jgi:YihY family inner membrane protein